MIVYEDPPRAQLDQLVDTAAEHLKPIYEAVRHGAVNFGYVPQSIGRFKFPAHKPVVGLISDDYDEAFGPGAFHAKSLRRFIAGCGAAAIVAGFPYPAVYAGMTGAAMLTRRSVVIIETRPEHEADWAAFVQTAHPGLPTLISTTGSPSGAVH